MSTANIQLQRVLDVSVTGGLWMWTHRVLNEKKNYNNGNIKGENPNQ